MGGDLQQKPPQILMVPTPGMGHLIPLIEFAKQLVFHHGLEVTILIPSDHSPSKPQITTLNSLPNSITYAFLPPVDLSDLPDDAKVETRFCHTLVRSLPSLRDQLRNKTTPFVALVVDLFGTDIFDVAKEFEIPAYLFFPGSAMGLSMFFEFPKLAESYVGEFRDLPKPIEMPGCIPLEGKDFSDAVQDRKNERYEWLLHHSKRYNIPEGILVNSFVDMEPDTFRVLMDDKPGRPKVCPVGPLIRTCGADSDGGEPSQCLSWLDQQPYGSVLFVAFGSGGNLTHEQFTELAFGLEMSEERFLWAVRAPSSAADASFFDCQSVMNTFDFLPTGFLERTRHMGLVVPSWAPQIEILRHSSTGGFVTHCGWNSALESIVHGVPMIAWPLYAEQRLNAVQLHGIKVALRPKNNENGLISREEIAKVVKGLMKGEEGIQVRNKMKELKSAAVTVLSVNGSSKKSLCKVTDKWGETK